VCNIGGTNFGPYVKFLGGRGLNLPNAVLTDLDPVEGKAPLGRGRIRRLLDLKMPAASCETLKNSEVSKEGRRRGLFLNTHTLEVDLFRVGNHEVMCETLRSLTASAKAKERAQKWSEKPDSLDISRFLKDIEAIGKGRYAQRLASTLSSPS
jgi:putative ATP-dependent endonuclease of OLD family